jgi:hypothetical protein
MKKGAVHIKDDFNPFKHNKVVEANQISACCTLVLMIQSDGSLLQLLSGLTVASATCTCSLPCNTNRPSNPSISRHPVRHLSHTLYTKTVANNVFITTHTTLDRCACPYFLCGIFFKSRSAHDAWHGSSTTWCICIDTVHATNGVPTRDATERPT